MPDELALCVEAAPLEDGLGTGLVPGEAARSRVLQARPYFIPRSHAETWPRFRQLIPYVVLRYRERVGLYRRTRRGSEARLHDRVSLGFGGHVGLGDAVLHDGALDLAATLERAARREVAEEVCHAPVVGRRFLGLLLLQDNPVSRVHLGMVELWDLAAARVEPVETKLAAVTLLPVSRLEAEAARMESWSQACLPALGARSGVQGRGS